MSIYLPSDYEPIDRSQILSRYAPRDDMRPPGCLIIRDLSGISLEWTLIPDRRDVRRYRAFDLDGRLQHHAAGGELLRAVAAMVPRVLGRRQWG